MSMTPSLSTSPRAGAEPMKPADDALAFGSVQTSCPLEPLSMRRTPLSQVLTVSVPHPQHVAPTLPEMNTMTGESRLSISRRTGVVKIRPMVQVDHTVRAVRVGRRKTSGTVHLTTGFMQAAARRGGTNALLEAEVAVGARAQARRGTWEV